MAAVHSSNTPATTPSGRRRAPSDPFSDANYQSNNPFKSPTRTKQPPQPPPKSPAGKMSATTTYTATSRSHRDNLQDAVRDTVTVRTPDTPRTRMNRSQTANPNQPQPAARPTHGNRRSQSQDSVLKAAAALERAKTSSKGRSKKGSQHADVIDRLDFTGVGPMFHHDGPFDACAPSRNRQRTRAPMLAWSGDASPADLRSASAGGPYPSADAFRGMSAQHEAPRRKVDAIAEAWGMHEPEPYEDFSAGGGSHLPSGTPSSSIYNGREGTRSGGKRGKESSREQADESARRHGRRTTLPPPQPIFVGDEEMEAGPNTAPMFSPPLSPGGDPKRNKSIMGRIRRMRDAPNVPGGDQLHPSQAYDTATYGQGLPPGPGHQKKDSFLGRLGGGSSSRNRDGEVSPNSDSSDPYVYVDDKALPATPGESSRTPSGDSYGDKGYFSADPASPSGAGVTRKTSLMKKMRGVVQRNK